MAAVILVAILLAVFRAGSFMGLAALSPFVLTVITARSKSSRSAQRRPFWIGVFGTLLLPFVAAVWINHEMWGYFVSRPDVDRRIVDARRIDTVTRVETTSDARGRPVFTGGPIGEVDSYIQVRPEGGDYYVLAGRVLRDLKGRQVLPANTRTLSADRLASLYQLLEDTGRLEDGETGYPNAKQLSGIVVESVGRDGHPLLFVGVRGCEVSNDHYPYYEFLFTGDSLGEPLKLLSVNRFYYDIAGLEGAEWPGFFLVFAFIGLIPTLLLQIVFPEAMASPSAIIDER